MNNACQTPLLDLLSDQRIEEIALKEACEAYEIVKTVTYDEAFHWKPERVFNINFARAILAEAECATCHNSYQGQAAPTKNGRSEMAIGDKTTEVAQFLNIIGWDCSRDAQWTRLDASMTELRTILAAPVIEREVLSSKAAEEDVDGLLHDRPIASGKAIPEKSVKAPTAQGEPVAWKRRLGKKTIIRSVTEAKCFDDDMPLYAAPIHCASCVEKDAEAATLRGCLFEAQTALIDLNTRLTGCNQEYERVSNRFDELRDTIEQQDEEIARLKNESSHWRAQWEYEANRFNEQAERIKAIQKDYEDAAAGYVDLSEQLAKATKRSNEQTKLISKQGISLMEAAEWQTQLSAATTSLASKDALLQERQNELNWIYNSLKAGVDRDVIQGYVHDAKQLAFEAIEAHKKGEK